MTVRIGIGIGIGLPNQVRNVDPRILVDWATRSEAAGFASLGTVSRIAYPGVMDTVALAAAAGATRTIELLSGVVIGPAWPAVLLAKEAAGIDGVSGGRLTLGLNRTVIDRSPWDDTDLFRWGHSDPDEPLDLTYLVTVGNTAYGLDSWAVQPWQIGPDKLDQLTGLPQPATWHEIPRGGLHLDPATRHATAWSTDPVLGLTDRFADRWPGWTLEFCQDRYQEQERRSPGAFRFPDPSLTADQHTHTLAVRAAKHWAPATPDYIAAILERLDGNDQLSAMSATGLTISELQKLVDLLLDPAETRTFDVAAYARRHFG